MAIQVGEKFNSPRLTTGRKSSAESRWWITGTGDENAAKAALCAAAPASIGGAAEVTMTTPTGTVILAVWPFLVSSDVTVEQVAPGLWDGILSVGGSPCVWIDSIVLLSARTDRHSLWARAFSAMRLTSH